MVNGSVADRLCQRNGTPPLSWETRANIALGTARGLCHLHANNIIHGDIKSGNILLDKHFEPKIGDFGLARGGADTEAKTHITMSMIIGTKFYLPDDFMRHGQLTPEVDTFSFGMFLFEMVSGKGPSVKIGGSTVRDIMLTPTCLHPGEMVDPNPGKVPSSPLCLPATINTSWPVCMFKLGKDCTQTHRKERPSMSKVFSALSLLHQYPVLQNKAQVNPAVSSGAARQEPFLQVQFPGPIPTVLESSSSEGFVFNVRDDTYDDNTTSEIIRDNRMNEDRSRSMLQGPREEGQLPSIPRNPARYRNVSFDKNVLPCLSEHIEKMSFNVDK